MMLFRCMAAALTSLILALGISQEPSMAAGPQASGSGVIRSVGSGAAFILELNEGQPLVFAYLDYATDPPRVLAMANPDNIDCLGEFFGGQTMRLTGEGSDTVSPDEVVTIQLFLVDGGEAGLDQVSLKVSRQDGTVVYFAGLMPLESGSLTVSCPL
jgi:hypothetical protein